MRLKFFGIAPGLGQVLEPNVEERGTALKIGTVLQRVSFHAHPFTIIPWAYKHPISA